MACDVCGKSTTELETLNDPYKTDDFKVVCPTCARELNDYIWKVRRLSNSFLRNMVIEKMQSERDRAGIFTSKDKK